ncbi:hypothetical protein J7E73_12355 [Paenibacillus albidus]|uniref:hypothetical protein n=1 Tax=Paenibacillus albidus TaxID=2041023 RepID=UPI001BE78103|nr:hypothetical protein [Paenibacillus albidus]MBT2289920.1 hypothetical protein [Paenibacillus albidus]
MSRQAEQRLKRDRVLAFVLIGIGVIAAAGGWMNSYYNWADAGYFIGIACGGLSGGIGCMISVIAVGRSGKLRQNYEHQQDERNTYIRTQARSASYRVMFYSLCAATFVSAWGGWRTTTLCLSLMGLNVAAYLFYLMFYSYRY